MLEGTMSSTESPFAFDDGRRACLEGKGLHDNPYSPYYASHDAWKKGWLSMHEFMMLDLKEKKGDTHPD